MQPPQLNGTGDSKPLRKIRLRELAKRLQLSPATVSIVLNGTRLADAIPDSTKERILTMAQELNYRPHYLARSLSMRQSFSLGVIVPELSEGYAALVLSGIESYLQSCGYFYFVVSHHHDAALVERYPRVLVERSCEGLILIDTPVKHGFPVPAVAVSGHTRVDGVHNILLDHDRAARLALEHLASMGHRRIGFINGQSFTSDAQVRWEAYQQAAHALGLPVDLCLVDRLEGATSSPELGYEATRRLLQRGVPTALVCFNDVAAIGAMHYLRQSGLDVPADVSVIGFDDILNARFTNPPLTTLRQPLRHMGSLAAELLLHLIRGSALNAAETVVSPELVIRQSTSAAAHHV
jgi:DNA-binding LacI/PurR family transcriptional regulator